MAYYSEQLTSIFDALSDPTRRAVLGQLGRRPTSVTELARPFDMALPSFLKHIHVLESSGLIRTRKTGRVRTCTIERKPLMIAESWLCEQRAVWEERTDRLEQFVLTEGKRKRK
jgi:DNA-binding transcriptional ArsR family regulator